MELIHREGLARVAKFSTQHGIINTPTIMPVVNPNLRILGIEEMKKMGMEALITNSYIIRRNKDLMEHALEKGVHDLVGYNGPIMTDSGTFQSYVYGDIEYGNLEIVDFQEKIGSDISTILDIFSVPEDSHEKAESAVDETFRRMSEIEGERKTIIAGPIQGSVYPNLREKSAKLMSGTRAGYLPIGGVVPLLEQYRYGKLCEIILNSKINASFDKPIHLFGGGHPMFMGMAVLLGVDVFDSASYVKYARDGRMLFQEGTRDLKEITEFPMWSPLFGKYTAKELKDASTDERARELARHNLFTIFMELKEIKERIYEQTLWQYVVENSSAHPALYSAFRNILKFREKLEPFFELYRKPPFYYFDETSEQNPYFLRMKKFTGEFLKNKENSMMVPTGLWQPSRLDSGFVSESYEKSTNPYLLNWMNMNVPVELEEVYPVEQVISSSQYEEWIQNTPHQIRISSSPKLRLFDLEKIRAICDFQFGIGTGKDVFPENTEIIKSRATGRIRTISIDGKLLATMRAHDGFLGLNVEGAKRLLQFSPYPRNRVVVDDDSAQYNARGYNVFCKFIIDFDPEIVPFNDVIVVDKTDQFLAVGKAMLSGREFSDYKSGMAVSVNHHLLDRDHP
ncbi:MAG: tRNA guanosine(15) transglycosylase TgtA [Thermoplasmataceae archaeon]